jgi:hypothetical protein
MCYLWIGVGKEVGIEGEGGGVWFGDTTEMRSFA